MMNKADLIDTVKQLRLDQKDYIVIGSGIIAALDIREADDIDIVASKDVFDNLASNANWSSKTLEDGTLVLINGIYEIGLDRELQNARPTLKELKEDQIIIHGVPFISLDRVMDLKRKRGWEKDLKDIRLIKDHLAQRNL